MVFCAIVFLAGIIFQFEQLKHINIKTDAKDFKAPIFIFIGSMVTTAGVVGFGRPYGPLVTMLIGIVGVPCFYAWAWGLQDWWDKIVLLFTLLSMVVEYFFYGFKYATDD